MSKSQKMRVVFGAAKRGFRHARVVGRWPDGSIPAWAGSQVRPSGGAGGVLDGRRIAASKAGSGTMSSGTVQATAMVRGDNSSAAELRARGMLTVTGACYGCSL